MNFLAKLTMCDPAISIKFNCSLFFSVLLPDMIALACFFESSNTPFFFSDLVVCDDFFPRLHFATAACTYDTASLPVVVVWLSLKPPNLLRRCEASFHKKSPSLIEMPTVFAISFGFLSAPKFVLSLIILVMVSSILLFSFLGALNSIARLRKFLFREIAKYDLLSFCFLRFLPSSPMRAPSDNHR